MDEQRSAESIDNAARKEKTRTHEKRQKRMRDMGFIPVDDIVLCGITQGKVLEIDVIPGYLGLEWLKETKRTSLYWLAQSEDVRTLALGNAKCYGFEDRVTCLVYDGKNGFPFKKDFFDGVISHAAMHGWDNPLRVFNNIHMVLKRGCKFYISDLKAAIAPKMVKILKSILNVAGESEKEFLQSIENAYSKGEVIEILSKSKINHYDVVESRFGLTITGMKT